MTGYIISAVSLTLAIAGIQLGRWVHQAETAARHRDPTCPTCHRPEDQP